MKFNQIFVAIIIIFLTFDCYSQLKINSTGKVGINQTYPEYNLDLYGTARFWTTWGSLIFDSTGPSGSAVLYPSTDWVGHLGKEPNKFGTIWTHTVNYNNLYDWSDEIKGKY